MGTVVATVGVRWRKDLPVGYDVPPADGGGREDTAYVIFFVDDVISVEVQWFEDGRRCLDLSKSLAGVHFEVLGKRGSREQPVLASKTITAWATGYEVLGFWVDAESITISLPQRKVDDLVEWLRAWPPGIKTAMVREVLILAGK